MPYRIGFDVGGTFTDLVLQSPSGELLIAKRLTTYPDPSEACLAGLDELVARSGVTWRDVAQAVHGTTLGSNVVIERKARGVGLLTTRGFRDVLLIGREKRYQVYDLQIEKPAPLIPRRLIGEVTERVLADGSVRSPLDEADARRAVRELVAREVTTLAICLLHAYLNPLHERRLAEIVGEEAPHVTVTMSHEVSPTLRGYERTSTTTAFELHRVNNAQGSGLPMNIQAIDLVEIGAGGGSIARARLGVIAVGPESASSVPGPVCYGRGGVEPTVTDANVVLGYINPDYFAGGSVKLEPAAATRAIETKVGAPLGLSLEDAAWGIHATRSADARYVGQGYELTVPVPSGELDAAALARVRATFDEVYAARYGYANPREPVEVVTWKLSAVGGSPRIALAKAQTEDR